MNKRPVDMTNPKNVYCGHCGFWDKNDKCPKEGEGHKRYCRHRYAGKVWTAYWNRCKFFKWSDDIVKKEISRCDRCGQEIKEYVPLNAIPRGMKRSVPFTLRVPTAETFCTMREGRFCGDCVQSFFDWWEKGKEGDGK